MSVKKRGNWYCIKCGKAKDDSEDDCGCTWDIPLKACEIEEVEKMKKISVPNTWDECKTPEQKQAFKDDLEKIDKTGKFQSFDEYIFEEHMRELAR